VDRQRPRRPDRPVPEDQGRCDHREHGWPGPCLNIGHRILCAHAKHAQPAFVGTPRPAENEACIPRADRSRLQPAKHAQGECMNTTSSVRGAGLLLVAAVGWGGLFPVAMVTLPVLDPFHMTAIRYGITAAVFACLLAIVEGPQALRLEGRGLRAAALGTAG